jgi:adenylate cyclase
VKGQRALVTVVAPAAAIAALVGVLAALLVPLGAAHRWQNAAVDGFFPRGTADPRVMVVAVDPRFVRRAALDPLVSYANLVAAAALGQPQTVLPQRSFIDTAQVQIADSQAYASVADAIADAFATLPGAVYPLAAGHLGPPRAGSRLGVRTQAVLASPVGGVAAATAMDTTTAQSPTSIVRTLPLAVELRPGQRGGDGVIVPSLALLGWLRAAGIRAEFVERDDALVVGGHRVPTEGDQELRVSYSADLLPGGRQVVNASDVVDGRVPLRRFRDKVVLIGVSDPTYSPGLPVPTANGRLPDVYVQANALNTLLTGQYLVPDSDVRTVLAVVLVGFVVALLVLLVPLWASLFPALVMAGAWWVYAGRRFDGGHLTDLVLPLASIGFAFVCAAGWKGLREFRDRRRVSQMFARYVPRHVAAQLLEPGAAAAVAAGQRLVVAVLFCDLRGFTALSAKLEPAQVRMLLDAYYERVSSIVLERSGTVMKFVGDEVFAVFGAPLPVADCATVALDCCRAVVAAGSALNDELTALELPAISYGIGLHYGEVVAAHVGSTTRRQYDVVGDTVNVGSRLCDQATSGAIVFSDELRRQAGEPDDAANLGTLTLKGVSRPITGYRITGPVVDAHPVTAPPGGPSRLDMDPV